MKSIKGMIIFSAVLGFASAGWAEGEAPLKGSASKQGIRVAIRNAPGVDEAEWTRSNGTSGTDVTDSQDGVQIDVMYAKRFMGKDGNNIVGPMVAGGVFLSNSSGIDPSGTGEIELTAFGFIAEGGIAIQLGKVVVLEAAPFLGVGGAAQEITGFTTGSGPYVLYGVKSAIYFQIGRNIELGLEAGYAGFSSYGEVEWSNGDTGDFTVTGGGFQGAGVFVIKF